MKDPFEKLLALEWVLASYFYSRTGELIAMRERSVEGLLAPRDQLGSLAQFVAESNQQASEVILFYPKWLLLFRVLGDRILALVAETGALPSLLRVTVDVAVHEWQERGLHRLFPRGQKRGSKSVSWRRILGRQ